MLLSLSVSAFAEPQSDASAHDRAIELAREGLYPEALEILRSLRIAEPGDLQLLYDQTVVLGWANRDDEVLENAKLIGVSAAPGHVIRAVAKSARNAGEYALAARWYEELLGRDPSDLDARIGLARGHADASEFDAAWATLDAAPADQRTTVSVSLTEAYIFERQGRFMDALASYEHVLAKEPRNQAALRGQVLTLRMALLPKQALALAGEHPGIISEQEVAQLEADVVALQVRHGTLDSHLTGRRHETTDRALSRIDALLGRTDLEPGIRKRLRHDRIVALVDRLQMAEAILDFESLAEDSADLPVYLLVAAGRAYLSTRNPERAREVLEEAVARDADNLEARFQLFFAYADLQHHRRAHDLADSLLATIPPTNRVEGSPVVKPSRDYLRAAIVAGLARAFADNLAESQAHFEALLIEAPHNTDLRQELANVYRWRGWLDRSVAEYAQVLAVEPDLLSARIGKAHADLDSRQYVEAEEELSLLREWFGDEPAVVGLDERWRTHVLSVLQVNGEFGESSGATFGEDTYRLDATWFSRPIAHRFRAILDAHEAVAEFPEGEARRRRLGAGVEYRYGRWLASARLSDSLEDGDLGFRGAVDYRLSDVFSFGGIVETHSDATPLRGERVGVSSDLLGLGVRYARHESTSLNAQLRVQDFSDGNAARSIFLGAEQRLLTGWRNKLSLIGELYAEDRDRDDVTYFSPRTSSSWMAGLRNEFVMYRRYDAALVHRLSGKAGRYRQDRFPEDDIWSLDYELVAEFRRRFSARVGVSRRSMVYDGTREYITLLSAGFAGRF